MRKWTDLNWELWFENGTLGGEQGFAWDHGVWARGIYLYDNGAGACVYESLRKMNEKIDSFWSASFTYEICKGWYAHNHAKFRYCGNGFPSKKYYNELWRQIVLNAFEHCLLKSLPDCYRAAIAGLLLLSLSGLLHSFRAIKHHYPIRYTLLTKASRQESWCSAAKKQFKQFFMQQYFFCPALKNLNLKFWSGLSCSSAIYPVRHWHPFFPPKWLCTSQIPIPIPW